LGLIFNHSVTTAEIHGKAIITTEQNHMWLYPVQQHWHWHNKELCDLFKQTSLLQSKNMFGQMKAVVSKWLVKQYHNSNALITLTVVMAFTYTSGTHNFHSICLGMPYWDIHHLFRGVICHAHCQVLHHDTLTSVAIPRSYSKHSPFKLSNNKYMPF